jgi:hypothetical protein
MGENRRPSDAPDAWRLILGEAFPRATVVACGKPLFGPKIFKLDKHA